MRLESLFLFTLFKKKFIWKGLPLFLDGYKLDVTALIYSDPLEQQVLTLK